MHKCLVLGPADGESENHKGAFGMTFNPLDYWGQLAVNLTKDVSGLKEQIRSWWIMLNSPEFNGTDAALVRDEMKALLEAGR